MLPFVKIRINGVRVLTMVVKSHYNICSTGPCVVLLLAICPLYDPVRSVIALQIEGKSRRSAPLP